MLRLEDLPIELVEHLVKLLELSDFASLRLTCRLIENKSSEQFAKFFKEKNIKLTSKSLNKFVRILNKNSLGCHLQHCVLTGIATTKECTASVANLSRLLAKAFQKLKQHSPDGGLTSLSLNIVARTNFKGEDLIRPDQVSINVSAWRAIWDAAASTFRTAMTALEASQMSVGEHLDIFGNVTGCSLACDVFMAHAGLLTSIEVFGSLKKLTLSLSAPYSAFEDKVCSQQETMVCKNMGLLGQAQARCSRQVLQAIMKSSPAIKELEELDLHWYNLQIYLNSDTIPENIAPLRNDVTAPRVKSCKLRGFFLSEMDLLQFIQATGPNALALREIYLNLGKFDAIFQHLNHPDSSIKSYHLDDLRQPLSLVHFKCPGTPKFDYFDGTVGPSTLTRHASDTKEPISYCLPPGRAKDDCRRRRWLESRVVEFGPPSADGRADIRSGTDLASYLYQMGGTMYRSCACQGSSARCLAPKIRIN